MILEVRALRLVVEERVLIRELSFQLTEGEAVAIVGPSGSGKTRLLRALAGLDGRAGGEIRLRGESLDELPAAGWRAEVHYLSQQAPAWPGTPAELRARVEGLGAQQGRASSDPVAWAEAWGLGSESWAQPWSSLSGGERQRLALALALSREPALLLLDEPTAALDEDTTLAVEASLRGRSAIWVGHDRAQRERLGLREIQLGEGA